MKIHPAMLSFIARDCTRRILNVRTSLPSKNISITSSMYWHGLHLLFMSHKTELTLQLDRHGTVSYTRCGNEMRHTFHLKPRGDFGATFKIQKSSWYYFNFDYSKFERECPYNLIDY